MRGCFKNFETASKNALFSINFWKLCENQN